MKNIVLAPVIVLGCAVLGVIGGALYFGAVIGGLDWMAGSAATATDLGRRVSFPVFAFGIPAGAVIGVRLINALLGEVETAADVVATILGILVALPLIVLPLYASFVPAFMTLTKSVPALGYVSLLGFAYFAFESRKLTDAVMSHRNLSTR